MPCGQVGVVSPLRPPPGGTDTGNVREWAFLSYRPHLGGRKKKPASGGMQRGDGNRLPLLYQFWAWPDGLPPVSPDGETAQH